jgi:predicted regulator of Ras-like GTPase activity (Roadblock/LC7/MglB family)
MGSLPQLIDEDMQEIDGIFADFLKKAEAQSVLLLAEGGFLVCSYGNTDGLDTMSLGALASNSFEANKMIAGIMGEPNFNSIYQAGEQQSVYTQSIDGFNVMVVIFPVSVGVGLVRHYALTARDQVAKIFTRAKERAPENTLDLAMMNVTDSSQIFQRRRKAS